MRGASRGAASSGASGASDDGSEGRRRSSWYLGGAAVAIVSLGLVVAGFFGGGKDGGGSPLSFLSRKGDGDSASPSIVVYMNGEDEGGILADLTLRGADRDQDLGALLSGLHGCRPTNPIPGVLPEDAPCLVFSSLGRRVKLVGDIQELDDDFASRATLDSSLRLPRRLYLVPPDRSFYWPGVEVGHKVSVPHVSTPDGKTVTLETLSKRPRVFLLENFFTDEEADEIVASALAEQSEEHRLKRSTTGTVGKELSKLRTSENAFLTHSAVSIALKKRIFSLLGIEDYEDSWADGLQVLRYNTSQAYVSHYDYLDPVPGDHDFDSAGLGTNRWATVVLYLSDVEEGGQTVFTRSSQATKGDEDRALQNLVDTKGDYLRSIGVTAGSWEEKLLAQCSVHLITKPRKGSAVMFYSQHPSGGRDHLSEHGACPVTKGLKWAANLWVWNGPRHGLSMRDEFGRMLSDTSSGHVSLTVKNIDVPGASLFYGEASMWEENFAQGSQVSINSYATHEWVAKVGGKIVKRWIVKSSRPQRQVFELRAAELEPET